MVPLVMFSAALILKLPLLPISSVWLALLIVIARFVVALLELIFRSEAVVLPIAKVRLLLALLTMLPDRTSLPLLAVIVPLPVLLPITLVLTLPAPISLSFVSLPASLALLIAALPPSS